MAGIKHNTYTHLKKTYNYIYKTIPSAPASSQCLSKSNNLTFGFDLVYTYLPYFTRCQLAHWDCSLVYTPHLLVGDHASFADVFEDYSRARGVMGILQEVLPSMPTYGPFEFPAGEKVVVGAWKD